MRRKILRWSALRPLRVPLLVFALLLAFSCGSHQTAEVAPAAGTGSVAFSVKWEPPPASATPTGAREEAVRPLAPVDICTVVHTINVSLLEKGPPETTYKNIQATALCNDNSVKLSDIDAGIDNLRVRIFASPGDWVGYSVYFKLNPGENKDLGVIPMTQPNTGVASPTFSPASGTYTTTQSVTLSTTPPEASIRYTTDGSIPSDTVGTVYTDPISIPSSVTIWAVAYLPGASSVASSATYTITPPTPPATPTNLAATGTSSSTIGLTWTDASSDESGFKIERSSTGSTSGFQQIGTVGANATSYSDSGLTPSTPYWYRVRAYNAAGDSAYSDPVGATTPSQSPTPPVTPTNLAATGTSSSTIGLTWTDASNDETGFKIERSSTDSPTGFQQIGTVGANATSYNDSGLTPSTPYWYRVRAYNAVGDSAYSNPANATTLAQPPTPPATPTNLAATGTSSFAIRLTWTDASNNENGYQIERSSTGPTSGFQLIASGGPNLTSFNDEGGVIPSSFLSPSTTYWYRVRAYNSAGNSGYSTVTSAITAGRAYVANAGGTLSVIDLLTNNVLKTITIGSGAFAVATHPAQKRVYVTNHVGGTVSVIDMTTHAIVATVDVGVGSNPQGIGINRSRNKVYVTCPGSWGYGPDSVKIIDTNSNQVIATVPVDRDPTGVAVADQGNASGAFVSLMNGQVVVIDVATDQITDTIPIPAGSVGYTSCPEDIAYQDSTYRMYVLHNLCNAPSTAKGFLTLIYATTKAIDGSPHMLGAGYAAVSVSVNPAVNGNIYVTHPLGNSLSITEYVNMSLVGTTTVGTFPTHAKYVGAPYNRVYVSNCTSQNVSVVDASTRAVTGTIPVGGCPEGIAFSQ